MKNLLLYLHTHYKRSYSSFREHCVRSDAAKLKSHLQLTSPSAIYFFVIIFYLLHSTSCAFCLFWVFFVCLFVFSFVLLVIFLLVSLFACFGRKGFWTLVQSNISNGCLRSVQLLCNSIKTVVLLSKSPIFFSFLLWWTFFFSNLLCVINAMFKWQLTNFRITLNVNRKF